MDFTFTDILVITGQFLVITAVSFAVFCLLASFVRFQLMMSAAVREGSGGEAVVMAFETQIASQVSAVHRDPVPFVIMMIGHRASDGEPASLGKRESLVKWLEQRVRFTDQISYYDDQRMALIFQASRAAARTVSSRLVDDLTGQGIELPGGAVVAMNPVVCYSTYPYNGSRAVELHANLKAAYDKALAEGANLVEGVKAEDGPAEEEKASPSRDTSLVDELTGVLKAERIPNTLQKYIARYREAEYPASVICLDLDFLRKYNKQYGEAAVNQLIRQVSELLQKGVREEDLIGRYGGDKFVIAMGALPQSTLLAARRLCALVKKTAFPVSGNALKITVSCGVATAPHHGSTGKDIFECAQAALRVAKARGRNMAVLYDKSMSAEKPHQEEVVDTL